MSFHITNKYNCKGKALFTARVLDGIPLGVFRLRPWCRMIVVYLPRENLTIYWNDDVYGRKKHNNLSNILRFLYHRFFDVKVKTKVVYGFPFLNGKFSIIPIRRQFI